MKSTVRPSWQAVAEEASKERDPQRLMELIEQLNAALATEEARIPHARVDGKRRVLFVDDEESIRITMPSILRNEGFEVTVAANTAEALSKMRLGSFDVLLTDLRIDHAAEAGITLARAMRQINPTCATLILTGYPALETALQAIEYDVDRYILKPADIGSLVRTMNKLLDQRKL